MQRCITTGRSWSVRHLTLQARVKRNLTRSAGDHQHSRLNIQLVCSKSQSFQSSAPGSTHLISFCSARHEKASAWSLNAVSAATHRASRLTAARAEAATVALCMLRLQREEVQNFAPFFSVTMWLCRHWWCHIKLICLVGKATDRSMISREQTNEGELRGGGDGSWQLDCHDLSVYSSSCRPLHLEDLASKRTFVFIDRNRRKSTQRQIELSLWRCVQNCCPCVPVPWVLRQGTSHQQQSCLFSRTPSPVLWETE